MLFEKRIYFVNQGQNEDNALWKTRAYDGVLHPRTALPLSAVPCMAVVLTQPCGHLTEIRIFMDSCYVSVCRVIQHMNIFVGSTQKTVQEYFNF